MVKRPSFARELLSAALLASLGCIGYRTPLDDSGAQATAARTDAAVSPDFAPPSPDLARSDLAPDLGSDLARDLGVDLRPDVGPDLPRDVRPDLPPDLRDVGADLRDVGADLRDLGVDLPRDSGADRTPAEAGALAHCMPGEKYVLVLGGDAVLYRFFPDTLAVSPIASVSCGPPPTATNDTTLNSLTTSPIGPVYISNHEGQLCLVDPTSFTTTLTSFDPSQVSNNPYGMALLPDNTPAGQSLYVATNVDTSANNLFRIDLSSYALSSVGPIQPTLNEVELTAGPSGELYAFSIGTTSSRLLTIDPATAQAIDVTNVPAGTRSPSLALVNWQGTFYLFLADNSVTTPSATVFTYRKGDAQVVQVGTVMPDIIGAGVALCQ